MAKTTTAKPKTATKSKTKAKTSDTSVEDLALAYFKGNKEANAAASKAKKLRKELYIAMLNEGLTEVEFEEGFCDRYAKESTNIDPIKLQKYLSPEQFWEIIKINKGDASQFVSEAIIDTCSDVTKSSEDVHIRK